MTVPELLASLAIALFLLAFALYIVQDLDKLGGRVLADTGRGAAAPPSGLTDGSPAPYDWDREGWVA